MIPGNAAYFSDTVNATLSASRELYPLKKIIFIGTINSQPPPAHLFNQLSIILIYINSICVAFTHSLLACCRPIQFSEDILIRFMKGPHILYPSLSSIFLYYPQEAPFEICACLGISDLSITPLLESLARYYSETSADKVF